MGIYSYFIRKKTTWKTTWLGKLVVVLLLVLFLYGGRGLLIDSAASFISAADTTSQVSQADVILIENWDLPARSSIRASFQLLAKGLGKTISITEYRSTNSNGPPATEIPPYYHEILELYFKGEGVDFAKVKLIPIKVKDPVTWNTAVTVIDTLAAQGCRSMILVSPWHHSRRSFDVYTNIGMHKGIKVFCKPVGGEIRKDGWWKSDAGLSTVFGEVIKRIYYLIRVT